MAIAQGNISDTFDTNQTSISLSHTIAAGSDRILLVWVSVGAGEDAPTGVTYDGDALTLKTSNAPGVVVDAYLYFRIAPNVGTANIVISWSTGAADQAIGGVDYTGVDQSTTFGTAASNSNVFSDTETLSVSSAATELVVAAMQITDAGWTDDGSQTAIMTTTRFGAGMLISSKAGETTTVLIWTKDSGSGWHAAFGIPLKEAIAAGLSIPVAMYHYRSQQ